MAVAFDLELFRIQILLDAGFIVWIEDPKPPTLWQQLKAAIRRNAS